MVSFLTTLILVKPPGGCLKSVCNRQLAFLQSAKEGNILRQHARVNPGQACLRRGDTTYQATTPGQCLLKLGRF